MSEDLAVEVEAPPVSEDLAVEVVLELLDTVVVAAPKVVAIRLTGNVRTFFTCAICLFFCTQ